jgi:oxygen-independent coproporphyrinogen-3 oxidase
MSAFGIYVHWPYCAAICPYCDFNVYRSRDGDNEALLAAIEADMATHAARFGKREATSLFLGGGTPSLLKGFEIERIVSAADCAFGLAKGCEITLECNPEDAASIAEQAAAGVNRFSIGVQALDNQSLRALGRKHDATSGRRAVETAAATGQRVSLDLIYAREGQGITAWRQELRTALTMPIEHASLYQLTIEPDTAFARRVARGELRSPSSDESAAFYEATQEVCEARGFPAYEISNHARSPRAVSRHNLLYWRSQDWIGVGPGAHGRITHDGARIATEAQRRPGDYIAAVRRNGVGWADNALLSSDDASVEQLLMGLRIAEGVELARSETLRGRPSNAQVLSDLSDQGLLKVESGRIRLTARGRLVANAVAAELAAKL